MDNDPKKEQDSDQTTSKVDINKELRETEQEVMIELKLKTNEFLKKFKAHTDHNRVKMDNI